MHTVGAVSPAVTMGNVTLSGWWRLTNLALASELIETNDATAVSNLNCAIFMNGSQVAWSVTNAAGSRVSINPASGFMVANVWTHLGITWDGTTIRAYVNGVQVASTAGPAGPFPNWSDLQIGPAEGQIQDCLFFNAKLSDAEMAGLYAKRFPTQQLANLQLHIPIFTGSSANWGHDYSGKGRNFTNVNTPTDGTSVPPAAWGDDGTQVILLPDGGGTPATGAGQTVFNGSGAASVAVAEVGAGQTVFNGSGVQSSAVAESGTGQTVFNGTGVPTVATAAVADGRTVFNGSGVQTAAVAASADGRTLFNGTGAPAVAVATAGTGATVFNGSGNPTVAIAAAGDGRTLFNASAATGAAGTGNTVFNGSGNPTVSIAAVGAGQTVLNGSSTASSALAVAAQGIGQTTFNGSATASVAVAASADGRTLFNGTSTADTGGGGGPSVAARGPSPGNRRHTVLYGTRRRVR